MASLGGIYATWLFERIASKAVLLNPAGNSEGFYNRVRRHSHVDQLAGLRSNNFKREVDSCLQKRVRSIMLQERCS